MSLCMKTKVQFFTFVAVLAVVIFVYLQFANPGPEPWQSLVSETHKQINNLKKLNEKPQENLFADLKEYLERLGLVGNFNIVEGEQLKNLLPTALIPALSGSGQDVCDFLDSMKDFIPNIRIIVYDLGLGYWEKLQIKEKCEANSCKLQEFDFSKYPSHVKNLKLKAYRPIIIQEGLNNSAAVMYFTPEHRVTSGNIEPAVSLARSVGIAAWGLDDSSSAISHPKMFAFFQTDAQQFYFHRTVSGDRLLVFNTQAVHQKLMLPWVQCSLTADCIKPVGSQDVGCRTYRKPLYLYSGCHSYDLSALNIVLGLMFQFRAERYVTDSKFFVADKKLLADKAAVDLPKITPPHMETTKARPPNFLAS